MPKANDLEQKINNIPTGEVVFLSDFPEYDIAYVCRTFASKCKENVLVKLGRGIYCKAQNTKFGPLLPSSERIVEAIAKRDCAKILPCGNTALNLLGLSTQVPLKLVYITNGTPRVLSFNNIDIKLERAAQKNFEYKDKFYALLAQAIKSLGQENINGKEADSICALLQKHNNPQAFDHDIRLMPMWIRKKVKELKQ